MPLISCGNESGSKGLEKDVQPVTSLTSALGSVGDDHLTSFFQTFYQQM